MIGPTNANARYIKAISSSTNDHVVTFNGTGGNSIKDSGKTIGVSIPAPDTSTDVGMSLVVQNDGSLSYGVPPGNYVTLNTAQTISETKTFSKVIIGKATRHVTAMSNTTNQYRKVAEITNLDNWMNVKYVFRISTSVNVTAGSNQTATFALSVVTNGSSEITGAYAQFLSQTNAYFTTAVKVYWDTAKAQIWIDYGGLVSYNYVDLELLHTWDRKNGLDIQDSYDKLTLMNVESATLPTGMTLLTINPTLIATPAITSNGKEIINSEWIRSTEVDSTTNLSKNGLVHNTSNETITGQKTFSETVIKTGSSVNRVAYIKNSDMTIGSPVDNVWNTIDFIDKNGSASNFTRLAEITHGFSTTECSLALRAYNGFNADNSYSAISAVCNSSGDKFVQASYRTYNTANIYDVVTIGVLNSAIAMNGAKTFNSGLNWTGTMGTTYGRIYSERNANNSTNAMAIRVDNGNNWSGIYHYLSDTGTATISKISYIGGSVTSDQIMTRSLLSSGAFHNVTISSSSPSGGSDGDIWIKY